MRWWILGGSKSFGLMRLTNVVSHSSDMYKSSVTRLQQLENHLTGNVPSACHAAELEVIIKRKWTEVEAPCSWNICAVHTWSSLQPAAWEIYDFKGISGFMFIIPYSSYEWKRSSKWAKAAFAGERIFSTWVKSVSSGNWKGQQESWTGFFKGRKLIWAKWTVHQHLFARNVGTEGLTFLWHGVSMNCWLYWSYNWSYWGSSNTLSSCYPFRFDTFSYGLKKQ